MKKKKKVLKASDEVQTVVYMEGRNKIATAPKTALLNLQIRLITVLVLPC